MYAVLLRKNSDDSTWIWKFAASLNVPNSSWIARITHAVSRARSSNGGLSWKFVTMRSSVTASPSVPG